MADSGVTSEQRVGQERMLDFDGGAPDSASIMPLDSEMVPGAEPSGPKIDPMIAAKLKRGPEQQRVVGPLVELLVTTGWSLGMLEESKRPPGAPEHMTELELVTNLKYTKMPKGKDLVSEWNATYPQWSYGDDTRRFWRDYKRIRESVALALPTNRSMQQPNASTT
jgi:hypothetical protein